MRRAGAVVGARTIATSWAVSIVVRGEIRSRGEFVITVRSNSDTLDVASDRLINTVKLVATNG